MNAEKHPAVAGPVEPTVRQHTPGPWVAREWHDRDYEGECIAQGWSVTDSDGHRVPLYSGETADLSEAEANGQLIAAAPELLAALERLLNSGDVRDAADAGALKQARAAIAKAVGSAA
jgi:hypothetical protein